MNFMFILEFQNQNKLDHIRKVFFQELTYYIRVYLDNKEFCLIKLIQYNNTEYKMLLNFKKGEKIMEKEYSLSSLSQRYIYNNIIQKLNEKYESNFHDGLTKEQTNNWNELLAFLNKEVNGFVGKQIQNLMEKKISFKNILFVNKGEEHSFALNTFFNSLEMNPLFLDSELKINSKVIKINNKHLDALRLCSFDNLRSFINNFNPKDNLSLLLLNSIEENNPFYKEILLEL